MGFWTVAALLVATAAVISTVVSTNQDPQEDKGSVAGLANKVEEKFQQLFERFDRLELKVNSIIEKQKIQCRGSGGTEIMDEGGSVKPTQDSVHPRHTGSMESAISAHVDRLENILSELASVPGCQRGMALVRQPVLPATVNTPQNLTCESYKQPLSSCLWVRGGFNGTRQVVVIDHQIADNDGNTTVDGRVNFIGDSSGDLDAGRCAVNIESVTEQDLDRWSCTLISQNKTIFTGAVHLTSAEGVSEQAQPLDQTGVECVDQQTECLMVLKQVFDEAQHCAPCPQCDTTWKGKLAAAEYKLRQMQRTVNDLTEEADPRLYFASPGEGIKAYSVKTSEKTAVFNGTEYFYAIAYDRTRKKLYWTDESSNKMYRSESNGPDSEMVLDTSQYGFVRAVASDWIAGNIYFVSRGGYVIACNGETTRTFKCVTVMSGQGYLLGIALNPSQGIMYITKYDDTIMKAGMDGSNSRTIVRGLSHPCGIAIDFSSSLLYWADFGSMSIKSSNLDGSNVVTVVQLSSKPYGIAVAPQRLYWGLLIDKKVQTSTMTGGDIRTIYTGNREVRRLTFTAPNMPTNRTNPCTSQSCTTGVCVLTPTLFRCLS